MEEPEATVFVLYRRGIASYVVQECGVGQYEARLLKYTGNPEKLPPLHIVFWREGRHCSGDTSEQDLMDDLYDALQRKKLRESRGSTGGGSFPRSPYVKI